MKPYKPRYFIGLMTGTSLDSIDVALIREEHEHFELCDALNYPLSNRLKDDIAKIMHPGDNEIETLGAADSQLSHEYAQAVFALSQKIGYSPAQITAIGCHGQTIRHMPPGSNTFPFTLQIGDPNTLAALTGIQVVSDFRRKDMALGGHGAPLAPSFHNHLFRHEDEQRYIVNIGGIANLTALVINAPCVGYDTGPGNTLMDSLCQKTWNEPYDENGKKAESGKVNHALLNLMLDDAYFKLPAPKSTGREYFNLKWVNTYLKRIKHEPSTEDILATLTELTARSIINAIELNKAQNDKYSQKAAVYLCGGGTHNRHLLKVLEQHAHAKNLSVHTTKDLGIHPDWVEAAAFAWLAARRIDEKPGNLPSVTGASREAVLGGLYLP